VVTYPDCEFHILSEFNVSHVNKYTCSIISAFYTIARDCYIFRHAKENCHGRLDAHCYAANFKSSFAFFGFMLFT
jgi:hypothetical protein